MDNSDIGKLQTDLNRLRERAIDNEIRKERTPFPNQTFPKVTEA